MKTGRFSDVPPELYSPLSEQERREMLLAIADHPHLKCHVLKNELSAPEGMLGIEVMDNTLFISFYTPGKGMCFFNINESGVLMAFRNFFKDFPRNELYSEEESLSYCHQHITASLYIISVSRCPIGTIRTKRNCIKRLSRRTAFLYFILQHRIIPAKSYPHRRKCSFFASIPQPGLHIFHMKNKSLKS